MYTQNAFQNTIKYKWGIYNILGTKLKDMRVLSKSYYLKKTNKQTNILQIIINCLYLCIYSKIRNKTPNIIIDLQYIFIYFFFLTEIEYYFICISIQSVRKVCIFFYFFINVSKLWFFHINREVNIRIEDHFIIKLLKMDIS